MNVSGFAHSEQMQSKTELFIRYKSEYFTEKNGRFLHFNILRLEQEKYRTERVIAGLRIEVALSGSPILEQSCMVLTSLKLKCVNF